jgi:hypothetical protein
MLRGMRTAPHVFALALLVLVLASLSARGDWLQKGQDLLRELGGGTTGESTLSTAEIAAGLKDALHVGTERVVEQLGRVDGFNADPQVHIPLPGKLHRVQSALDDVGMGSLLDDLDLKLNRAAEAATPKAKALFWDAIRQMTLEDARAIYQGPDDAATRYFERKMSKPLAAEMRPIVEQSLSDVGAVHAYDNMMAQYRAIPFVPDVKTDLTDYVLDRTIAGIFHCLAQEEAAIRQDPAKRTTELLRRVFGSS